MFVAGLLIVLVEGMVRAVQQLEELARVNEELFRELQHRVANNLQIVAATLQKAQRSVQDLWPCRRSTMRWAASIPWPACIAGFTIGRL